MSKKRKRGVGSGVSREKVRSSGGTPPRHGRKVRFLNFREATPQGYGYTVFGKVVDGMDVVQKIAAQPTGAGGPFPKDVPNERVTIKSASVVSK